jgi:hypothetical protein
MSQVGLPHRPLPAIVVIEKHDPSPVNLDNSLSQAPPSAGHGLLIATGFFGAGGGEFVASGW